MHLIHPPTHFLPSPLVQDEAHLEVSPSCGISGCPFPDFSTPPSLKHHQIGISCQQDSTIPYSTTNKPGWDQIIVTAFSVLHHNSLTCVTIAADTWACHCMTPCPRQNQSRQLTNHKKGHPLQHQPPLTQSQLSKLAVSILNCL